jgi:hypothetical protein
MQFKQGVHGGEDFISQKTFSGSKPGYVFTTRDLGTGYYRE